MATGDGGEPTVLVVEDESEIRTTYRLWLSGDHEVIDVPDGEAALAAVEGMDGVPDVVLLDRLMPGLSGRETLAEMRERGYDCRYAVVTAVEPDFDIIEMGFDAYVTKPVTETELRDTLAELHAQTDYDDTLDEYTSLLSKREVLRARKTDEELADSDEYARFDGRLDELEAQLDETAVRTDEDAGFVATLRGIDDVDAGGSDRPGE